MLLALPVLVRNDCWQLLLLRFPEAICNDASSCCGRIGIEGAEIGCWEEAGATLESKIGYEG